ncbi:hypothetical protein EZ449_14335 [Pedobacter frigidisoli]|uniref:Ig-like domain-containing protein n=1 Tax=Pedobacter frigidisoli TaxID=2530455 RepID=A0A4R0P260_9SPHI|nr:hypothetical protein [Pedobacter frigidisoli]TCD07707.1 hypothetical protein EZ449_14335 [Pedobacter frigidisoli]
MGNKITLTLIILFFSVRFTLAQNITITNSLGGTYCAGSNFTVSFSITGSVWYSDNKFSIQLSDANGTFPADNSSRLIGNIQQMSGGTIVGTIPKAALSGSTYRVRVVSSNSVQYSLSSGAITINSMASPPTVSTPVNYAQCSSASPLSATPSAGGTLIWLDSTNGSVGGTSDFLAATYVEGFTTNPSSNKAMTFRTIAANVTITSVDFTIPANQAVNNLVLGIFNAQGSLLASSTTTTSQTAGSTPIKINNVFNYVITSPGNYMIGIVSGLGNLGKDPSNSYPINEASNSVSITGTTINGERVFNNVVFNLGSGSNVAPTPATTTFGSKIYYVKQILGGCSSDASAVIVNIAALAKPTVTTPISYTQFASAIPLSAMALSGASLYWSSSLNGSYTSTPITPSTSVIGTSVFYVKQMLGSCLSDAESITVNITNIAHPTVVSPVNYCLNSGASPLTATTTVPGAVLNWYTEATGSTSIGGTNTYTNTQYADNTHNNKALKFTTLKANVTVVSVDFFIPQDQTVSNVRLGIYTSTGTLLSQSLQTISQSAPNGSGAVRITAQFDYQISSAGDYLIMLSQGGGNFGSGSAGSYPLTEPSNRVSITGFNNGNLFNNLTFKSTPVRLSAAPIPLTSVAGTTSYYVTQSLSGSESAVSTINVIISNTASPTVSGTTPASRCGTGSVTLSASISAGSANWYSSLSGGTLLYTGLSYNINNLSVTTTYFVQATNGSCSSERVPVTATISTNTWTGAVSKVWSNAGNWNSCGIPGVGASVIVPVVTNYPELDVDVTLANLELQASARIYINGKTLTLGVANISSSLTGAGTISGTSGSSLVINGQYSPTLRFDQSTPGVTNTLRNITVNTSGQSLTLANALNVTELVNVSAGTLVSAGLLTLKSTSVLSANIGTLSAGADITGIVNIESYFHGGLNGSTPLQNYWRGTRMVSSPINDATLANKTFKQLQNFMIITGAGSSSNGFDPGNYQRPNATTVTRFNEVPSKQAFTELANIHESSAPGDGFFLFFRGDRTNYQVTNGFGILSRIDAPNLVYAVADPVTVTYSGPINKGTITKSVTNSANIGDAYNGYNVIGNPYPSALDFSKLLATNSGKIDDFAIVIKPGGGQVTHSGGYSTIGWTGFVQAGQAFYVKALTNTTLSFLETHKAGSIATPARLLSTPNGSLDQVKLMGANNSVLADASTSLRMELANAIDKEDVVVVFQKGNSGSYGGYDALHGAASIVELSTLSEDGESLAINFMPEVKDVKQVRLFVNNNETGLVKLKFTDLNAVYDHRLYLIDNFLNKKINVLEDAEYSFTIDKSQPTSFGSSRLVLVLEPETFPFKLTSFQADKSGTSASLQWQVQNEKLGIAYELERSADGKEFSRLRSVNGSFNGSGYGTYTQVDSQPFTGVNYYRIKLVEKTGRITYSSGETLDFTRRNFNGSLFQVYPTITDNLLTIELDPAIKDYKIAVSILNMSGASVMSNSSLEQRVGELSSGVYIVVVRDAQNGAKIGASKFIRK